MTYTSYENSRESGAPMELYHFQQGVKEWFFSSNASIITKDGKTYDPTPVERDRIKQSPEVFKNNLRLTFPRTHEFARQYLGFAPEEVTTLTIFRGHSTDPDGQFVFYWKGRVVGAKTSGNSISVDCESLFTSMRRPGLRARFEYTCRRTLYQRGCYVAQGTYALPGTVVSTGGGITINITEAGTKANGWFTGGMLTLPDGTSRFITAHMGANVTISRPIEDLGVGSVVILYPGCDHTRETCLNKFNNLDNFGGFPWIPSRNPFDGSSLY